MGFQFKKTDVEGLIEIQPDIYRDKRGCFLEGYRWDKFSQSELVSPVVAQFNISYSKKNVIRGLHFQDGYKSQTKTVHVLKGAVLDVVVDLRPKSKTFKQWRSFLLDDVGHKMLFVPVGCAHGFLSLADDTIFVYLVNQEYDPEHDHGIRWNDPELSIDWGIPSSQAIVSAKDQELPYLKEVLACGGLQVARVC